MTVHVNGEERRVGHFEEHDVTVLVEHPVHVTVSDLGVERSWVGVATALGGGAWRAACCDARGAGTAGDWALPTCRAIVASETASARGTAKFIATAR